MKILVDELPKGCLKCDCFNTDKSHYHICSLTGQYDEFSNSTVPLEFCDDRWYWLESNCRQDRCPLAEVSK